MRVSNLTLLFIAVLGTIMLTTGCGESGNSTVVAEEKEILEEKQKPATEPADPEQTTALSEEEAWEKSKGGGQRNVA